MLSVSGTMKNFGLRSYERREKARISKYQTKPIPKKSLIYVSVLWIVSVFLKLWCFLRNVKIKKILMK